MAVDQQDAPESLLGQAVEQVADHAHIGRDAQAEGAGEAAEVGRDAVGQHWEDRHAQRGGGLGRHLLGQDTVYAQAQVGVLLGAAQRQHGAVVVRQVVLDLLPVHLGYSHSGTS